MPETQGLTIVCAWCSRVMANGSAARVSHGICDECLPAMLRQIDELRPERALTRAPGAVPALA